MGIKKILKDEFQLKNLKLHNHEDPNRFVEWVGGGLSVIYVIYRIIIAAYFSSVMLYSWTVYKYGAKWIIYLTNWTMVFIVLTTTILAVNATVHYIRSMKTKDSDRIVYKDTPILFQIQWGMFTVMSCVSPMITALYWGIVWTPDFGIHIVNVTTHAVNSVYLLIDLIVTSIPTRLMHYYLPVIYATIYSIFTIIYWAAGGTGEGTKKNIYEVLDYSASPGTAIGYLLGSILVVGPLVLILVFTIYQLRECWRSRRGSVDHIDDTYESGSQKVQSQGNNNSNNSIGLKSKNCLV